MGCGVGVSLCVVWLGSNPLFLEISEICVQVHLANQNRASVLNVSQDITKNLILFSVPQTTLRTAAVVGIAVGSVIALIIGVVVGALLFYCISKHWCQKSKAETSSHKQQPAGFLLRSFVPAVEREILYWERMWPMNLSRLLSWKQMKPMGHVQHWFLSESLKKIVILV